METKRTETNLMRRLSRRGYGLRKFKDGYGVSGYFIYDANTNYIVCGDNQYPLTLEEVETFCNDYSENNNQEDNINE